MYGVRIGQDRDRIDTAKKMPRYAPVHTPPSMGRTVHELTPPNDAMSDCYAKPETRRIESRSLTKLKTCKKQASTLQQQQQQYDPIHPTRVVGYAVPITRCIGSTTGL